MFPSQAGVINNGGSNVFTITKQDSSVNVSKHKMNYCKKDGRYRGPKRSHHRWTQTFHCTDIHRVSFFTNNLSPSRFVSPRMDRSESEKREKYHPLKVVEKERRQASSRCCEQVTLSSCIVGYIGLRVLHGARGLWLNSVVERQG